MKQALTRTLRQPLVLMMLMVLLASCSGNGSAQQADTPTQTPVPPTPTSISASQPSPAPTGSPSEQAQSLVLWWPDALAPPEGQQSADVLDQQISSFSESTDIPVDIEFRLKTYGSAGGIMASLRSASNVAPGAMPDITLIRRSDLVSTESDGLVYPLDGMVDADTIGNLYDVALVLGQVDGRLYGLPYMVETQVLAYRPEDAGDVSVDELPRLDRRPWSFDAILERGESWTFPARRSNGLNDLFYVQYLDAGGTPPDNDGTLRLNTDALETVLSFYEEARGDGVIPDSVLDFSSPGDYRADLTLGEINAAVLDSTSYIEELYEGRVLLPASVPTDTGSPTGTLDGWIWVVTTSNGDQQELAASFLNWMMDVERQTAFAEVVHTLPSQRSAMQALEDTRLDTELLDAILSNARMPLATSFNNTAARALQNAFIAVLSGDLSAREAVNDVAEQLSNS